MTRALLLAMGVAILLCGIGLWAQSWLAKPELPIESVATPELAPSIQPSRPIVTATVLEVAGDAELFAPETQAWETVTIGTSLEESALLRTSNGSIKLTIGEATEVKVSRDSRLRLEELSHEFTRLNLEQGRLSATLLEGSNRHLAVNVLGSEATTTTAGGEFSLLRGEKGAVTVASLAGSVTVSSHDRSTVVHKGEQTTAAVGLSPSPALKIPASLFVKLQLAGNRKLRTRRTTVHGTTTPGSSVSVNGVAVTAINGRFSVSVPLTEGDNTVKVVAHDVLGRVQTKRISGLVVDSKPPKLQGSVQW